MEKIEVNKDDKSTLGHWDVLEDFYTILGEILKKVRTTWITFVNLDFFLPTTW